MYGYIPMLVTSQMPDPPVSDITLSHPTPEELNAPPLMFPPDTKNLIDKLGKAERETVNLGKALDSTLEELEIPQVNRYSQVD